MIYALIAIIILIAWCLISATRSKMSMIITDKDYQEQNWKNIHISDDAIKNEGAK
jgi:hypothetical protein